MHRNLNILMLGGAKRVAMAEQLIRAGKRLGCNVKIFSHELSNQEPIASIDTSKIHLRLKVGFATAPLPLMPN